MSISMRGIAASLLLVASSACSDPEGLVDVPATTTLDNPTLFGAADPVGWRWAMEQPFEVPARSLQTYGGAETITVKSNLPILIGPGMIDAPPPTMLPSGRAISFAPKLLRELPPYVWLPQECSTLTDAACATYRDKRFPFLLPGLMLPTAHSSVTLQLVGRGGGATPERAIDSITLRLDPAVEVVPVHVYVFRSRSGEVPDGYDPPFQGSASAVANNVRQIFDQAIVTHPPISLYRTREEAFSVAELAIDPRAPRTVEHHTGVDVPLYADDVFRPCNVQLRLAKVTFIDQAEGLEQVLTSPEVPERNSCSTSNPSPAARFGQAVRGTAPGIHVLVGGTLWAGTSGAARGFACSNNTDIYIDAFGGPQRKFRDHTLFHEIGHILMQSSAHSDQAANLMHPFSDGTLITDSQCQAMRRGAEIVKR